ncbi:MAG: DUF5701 family protein [Candidatus Nanopelagicales bacterium]
MPTYLSEEQLESEFDRQVTTLLDKGYPALAGMSAARFLASLGRLSERLADVSVTGTKALPFVLVVTSDLVPVVPAIKAWRTNGKPGFTTMEADELKRFGPIDTVEIPNAVTYLATDIATGADTLNVTPDAALPLIRKSGRSPLTIDEGVAVLTHHPDVLATHNAFSLLGSRCGDRRVTAIWSSEKGDHRGRQPRLGWCFAGAPHTWLGSASLGSRLVA